MIVATRWTLNEVEIYRYIKHKAFGAPLMLALKVLEVRKVECYVYK